MVLVSALLACSCTVSATLTAHVEVDLSAPTRPLPHAWERLFGSGHAALGLRDDWFTQLKLAREELGLQGIRQHGLLDDDMHVVIGHRQYNFTLVDKLFDRLVSLELKPVIELSFMPSLLANCSWMGPAEGSCHDDVTGPCKSIREGCDDGKGGLKPGLGCRKCHTGMAYGGVEEHPINFDDWRHLVQALVSHTVDRHGLETIQQWRFEVWVSESWIEESAAHDLFLFNAAVCLETTNQPPERAVGLRRLDASVFPAAVHRPCLHVSVQRLGGCHQGSPPLTASRRAVDRAPQHGELPAAGGGVRSACSG